MTFFYAYHDITNLGIDRAKMHKAFFDALKPRREGLHSRRALVHAVARVKTAQRSVRKIPFPGIEAKALVNHLRLGNKVNS